VGEEGGERVKGEGVERERRAEKRRRQGREEEEKLESGGGRGSREGREVAFRWSGTGRYKWWGWDLEE
jgi:hypothetical protein